jgi:hypothetical protein
MNKLEITQTTLEQLRLNSEIELEKNRKSRIKILANDQNLINLLLSRFKECGDKEKVLNVTDSILDLSHELTDSSQRLFNLWMSSLFFVYLNGQCFYLFSNGSLNQLYTLSHQTKLVFAIPFLAVLSIFGVFHVTNERKNAVKKMNGLI